MSDVDSGGGYACVGSGAGGIWEVSGSYSQFCCKPNTALKWNFERKKKSLCLINICNCNVKLLLFAKLVVTGLTQKQLNLSYSISKPFVLTV